MLRVNFFCAQNRRRTLVFVFDSCFATRSAPPRSRSRSRTRVLARSRSRMHRAAPAATALPLSLRVPAHIKPQFVTNVQKTLARVLNLRYYAIQTQI